MQAESTNGTAATKGDLAPTAGGASRWLLPHLSDWVFASLLLWLFFGHGAARTLLADGDTGWHIRTGEYVLANWTFPRVDLFSFSMEGKTWFAWEWFSDVLMALAYKAAELKGIVLLAGVVIAATAAALLRYMLWLGANVLLAVPLLMIAASASMVHWLARPHMFTWGLLLATIWLLEADRRKNSRRVYWLVPLAIVWTNTHGGFLTLLLAVGIYAAGTGLEQLWAAYDHRAEGFSWHLPAAAKRYGVLLLLCAAGTFVNPYGYQLHAHIFAYLGSDFILNNVQEFQSPDFRGESMMVYEGFLLLGLILLVRLVRRREIAQALLLLAWSHASLLSVRHVPLFMIVSAPLIARELTLFIAEAARSGNVWLKAVHSMAADYGGSKPSAASAPSPAFSWLPVVSVIVVASMLHLRADNYRWKAQFPEVRFPVAACDALEDRLVERRVLSSDQWSDYLIYNFYPKIKVFFDGRSDFYAPSIRGEYLQLLGSGWRWEEIVDRYEFDAALLPLDWALASTMKNHPDWAVVYDDGMAVYLERVKREQGR